MVAISSVCVFCGSSKGRADGYGTLAQDVGKLLAAEGIELVYGGGRIGLMGMVADSCMAAGGTVTGVIPKGLFSEEVGHLGLTQLHEVATMHERKKLMYDLADGFIGLPGGLGTLEEVAEAATWAQLGLHSKPVVLLDNNGFWEPLEAQLDHMVGERFLNPANRDLVRRCSSAADALTALRSAEVSYVEKWD